jgi:hypothetical protein
MRPEPREVVLSSLNILKSEAAALRSEALLEGRTLGHCAALERVAKAHGYSCWRSCRAALSAKLPSDPSQAAAIPDFTPYHNQEWGFGLDLPIGWNRFPTVLDESAPFEVARFRSRQGGVDHVLIVFRSPRELGESLQSSVDVVQRALTPLNFVGFARGETKIGVDSALTLESEQMQEEGLWHCRHYLFASGAILYTIGFGTYRKDLGFGLCDSIVRTFYIGDRPAGTASMVGMPSSSR